MCLSNSRQIEPIESGPLTAYKVVLKLTTKHPDFDKDRPKYMPAVFNLAYKGNYMEIGIEYVAKPQKHSATDLLYYPGFHAVLNKKGIIQFFNTRYYKKPVVNMTESVLVEVTLKDMCAEGKDFSFGADIENGKTMPTVAKVGKKQTILREIM